MKYLPCKLFPKITFTLTELLVVMAVLAILLTILIPSLKSSMNKARGLACANKLGAVTKLNFWFADDNNGCLVNSRRYTQQFVNRGYIEAKGIGENDPYQRSFSCTNRREVYEEAPAWGYSCGISEMNWTKWVPGPLLHSINLPSETFMFVELYRFRDFPEGVGYYYANWEYFPYYGHAMAGVQSYCDGHVTMHPISLMLNYWSNWSIKPWNIR